MAVIGIDIGGTTTIIAPGDEDGLLVDRPKIVPTNELLSENKLEFLTGLIEDYSDLKPEAIGIGLAGILDEEEAIEATNWEGINLRELPENLEALEIEENDIVYENDADAGLLGELTFGETDNQDTIYLNYGTGLGGSIWKDDCLVRGLELGFGIVNHELELDQGGAINPNEAFCSGAGIEMFLEEKFEQNPEDEEKIQLSSEGTVTEKFFEEVINHDPVAVDYYAEIKDINTQFLGGLTNVYGPEKIIFGGSVVSNNSFLVDYNYGKSDGLPVQDPEIATDNYLGDAAVKALTNDDPHRDNSLRIADEEVHLEDYVLDIRDLPELRMSEFGEYSTVYGAIASALQSLETDI